MSTSSKATVESTEFHQNYADNYGAGVNMDGSSRLTCTQCNISRNLDSAGRDSSVVGGFAKHRCFPGYSFSTYDQPTCEPCEAGKFALQLSLQNVCSDCSPGFYQDLTQQATCIRCTNGRYQPATGSTTCAPCASNCPLNLSRVNCKDANEGYCAPCLPGSYVDSTALECAVCPPSKFQSTVDQSSCSACEKGQYQNSAGQPNCQTTPAGYYLDIVPKSQRRTQQHKQ